MKNFSQFLNELKETNATLDYFTDFEKIKENIKPITLKLHQLNYLIGKQDLDEAIRDVFNENPKAFDVLNILIAVRDKKTKVIYQHLKTVSLQSYFETPEKIIEYMKQTGLADLLSNKNITNLVDYVFGIEVGLDSNARKNRGGNNMAKSVAHLFNQYNIPYQTEVSSKKFPDLISLGEDIKRFDFVIQTDKKLI